MTKYIFVTGGVVSSLGKGITAASLGRLLKERGYKVTIQKFDPYINVDPGTMSPYQHGEVFVTDDGAETDLDLGHYERFINEDLTKYNNVTNGKIMSSIINKERKGEYLGATVQYIPHVTNEIKQNILNAVNSTNSDIVITEIGGTIGDIESVAFIEAIRQFRYEVGRENVVFIHVSLLPYLKAAKELKTKPTQQSVKILQSMGINPDIIVLRSEYPVSKEIKKKISLFCDVDETSVIEALDANSIYEVPVNMEELGLADEVCRKLSLKNIKPNLAKWKEMLDTFKNYDREIKVAVVGKYVELKDAYISITEALEHAAYQLKAKVNIDYLKSEEIDISMLANYDGVLVPGGFGGRGIEGKIASIKYARENKVPFLGICLGMQVAAIEFGRNVLGLEDVNTEEINENCKNPVIHLMKSQEGIDNLGGTMRLGAYPCKLDKNSIAYREYKEELISERHRHRFEFNNSYKKMYEEKGFKFSGVSPNGNYVEVIELENHPYFVASQYHPEFKSRPNKAHPLFKGFIKAILESVETK
ncbi:CTP synthase [Oceanivirga miroungae]|uniref:CTP synthase n=1 Tax=Oceanivirga miroungae TaxID=1130046 RepID=A0A6I8MAX9_9FUSO|nr:CTP synthase [Oceanivirga miroungae]VWL85408.1 CTP synthetase [Oceanivirga miroungae]